MKNRYIKCWIFPAVALLLLGSGNALAGGYFELEFNASNFTNPLVIDNPYWPLDVTGTTFHYYAEEGEDECVINEMTITGDSEVVAGVTTRVIHDVEWLDVDCTGSKDFMLEETDDWYAQDDSGNIWYFGEDTLAYEWDEEECDPVSIPCTTTEGSWEAGVDGAEPGIVMLADPIPGLFYRQEYLEDEAEDMAKVLRLNAKVSIELDDFSGCLKTKEWTVLEPGSIEHKYYCPGIGLVYVEELKEKTVYVELVGIVP